MKTDNFSPEMLDIPGAKIRAVRGMLKSTNTRLSWEEGRTVFPAATAGSPMDDGSSAACQPIWNRLARNAVVLHHSENCGKGAALKTAFRYLLDRGAAGGTVITVDADGQRLPDNILKVFNTAHWNPEAIVLGVRRFGPDTSARSQIGSRLTSALFRTASRQTPCDTQSGLRSFPVRMLPWLLDISDDRYEYAMHMLFAYGQAHIPLVQTPIHTVYLDACNSTSHFNALRDSLRIAKTLLRFSLSSLTGFTLDYLTFLILSHLSMSLPYYVLLSNIAARVFRAASRSCLPTWTKSRVRCCGQRRFLLLQP